MGPPLDTLLSREVPGGSGAEAARARALAAARAELARTPRVRGWRAEAVRVFAASALLTLGVTAVMAGLGQTSGAVLLARAPVLLALWATGAACAWAALAPRARGLTRAAGLLALGVAGALVLTRGPGTASSLPGWVCTASHLGVGLVPGVVALLALRSTAFRPQRALLAGLCVGTTGAFVGELACAQGATHVLLHHLSAWALAALGTLGVCRLLSPRSFAP